MCTWRSLHVVERHYLDLPFLCIIIYLSPAPRASFIDLPLSELSWFVVVLSYLLLPVPILLATVLCHKVSITSGMSGMGFLKSSTKNIVFYDFSNSWFWHGYRLYWWKGMCALQLRFLLSCSWSCLFRTCLVWSNPWHANNQVFISPHRKWDTIKVNTNAMGPVYCSIGAGIEIVKQKQCYATIICIM